jgi:hypothetical protein
VVLNSNIEYRIPPRRDSLVGGKALGVRFKTTYDLYLLYLTLAQFFWISPASADLLAEQVFWQATAATRRQVFRIWNLGNSFRVDEVRKGEDLGKEEMGHCY